MRVWFWHRRTEEAKASAILAAAAEGDAEEAAAARERLRADARRRAGYHWADGPTRQTGNRRLSGPR